MTSLESAKGIGAITPLDTHNRSAKLPLVNPLWRPLAVVLCLGAACEGQVNSWISPTSGNWDQASSWSLGVLPNSSQSVMITNSGSKAVVIKRPTSINFSDAMTVSSLTIRGAADSENVLLLNHAGTNVPLTINHSLTLGTNASLISYNSAVVVPTFELDSKALFAKSSQLKADTIEDYASLVLGNSFASARVAFVRQNSLVEQSGGTAQFDIIAMEANSLFSVVNGELQVNYLLVQSAFFNQLTNGTATFVFNGGDLIVNSLSLGEPNYDGFLADFLFEGGNLVCSNYWIWNGTFEQSGGSNAIATLALPPGIYYGAGAYAHATYNLSAGTLVTSNLFLGQYFVPGDHFFSISPGNYVQSGGVHTNTTLVLQGFLFGPPPGYDQFPESAGFGHLSGGLLVSSNETVLGEFTQTGGTNQVQLLGIYYGGSYSLATGTLATVQTFIGGYEGHFPSCSPATVFVQQGGAHTVADSLSLEGFARYELDTGTLAAQDIFVDPTSQLVCQSGSVSNWGTLTLQGGTFVPGGQSHFLGQLQLWAVTNYDSCANTGEVSLDLSGSAGMVLRFRDSSSVVWSGPGLQLLGWQPWTGTGGSHHIFFGTNAQGLTPAQLSKITFVNPAGWPPGNYPARILDTGEVIPAAPITATRTSGGLILPWPGNYQ